MNINILLLILPIAIFSGCANKQLVHENFDNNIDMNLDKIKYQYNLEKEEELSDGSINFDNFEDLTENSTINLKVGDTIYIDIRETMDAQTRNDNILNKESSTALGGGGITSASGKLQGFLDKTINPYASVGINANSKSTFTGKANNTLKETLRTNITALVTEKISKKLFKIEAKKSIKLNNETKKMLLLGYVHTDNLDSDNGITSGKILNLQIDYITEGDITDTTSKGGIKRFFDKIF